MTGHTLTPTYPTADTLDTAPMACPTDGPR